MGTAKVGPSYNLGAGYIWGLATIWGTAPRLQPGTATALQPVSVWRDAYVERRGKLRLQQQRSVSVSAIHR